MGSPRSRARCPRAGRGRASHPSCSRCCTHRRPSMPLAFLPRARPLGGGERRGVRRVVQRRHGCDGRFVMDVLVRDHGNVFWGLPSMVDVGGGGARALAATFPHDATIPPGELGSWSSLRGTCLSTSPRPMPSSRSGNPGLLHLAFAIYIQPLKLNSDVLRCCDLVQWILHGWDDEQCVRILQRWSEAIPAAG
jgi:hypothetical protein